MSVNQSSPDFVDKLKAQAVKQSLLHKRRLLPKETDWLTSFVGNYPWQVMLALALLGAVLWELF